MRLTISAVIMALVLGLAATGCQRSEENVQAARENTDNRALTDADRNFLKKNEMDNIKQQNLARAVLEKSKNSDVRDYAQMLADDHTKALDDLVDLMNKKGMAQPKALPEAKHEALSKLNNLSGPAFDREFVNLMLEDHERTIAEFRQQESMTQDKDVKDYVRHMRPALEKHLRKAHEIAGKLKA